MSDVQKCLGSCKKSGGSTKESFIESRWLIINNSESDISRVTRIKERLHQFDD